MALLLYVEKRSVRLKMLLLGFSDSLFEIVDGSLLDGCIHRRDNRKELDILFAADIMQIGSYMIT